MRKSLCVSASSLLLGLVLACGVSGQEASVTRAIANPNYGTVEPVSVTLQAPAIEVDVTVVETIPDSFAFDDAPDGTIAGQTVTFTVPAREGDAAPQLVRAERGGLSVEDLPIIVENGLVDGALAMVDRTHVYTQVNGTFLEGGTYVRVANDDKNTADYALTVEADQDTVLYLLIDDRVGDDSNANPPTLTAAMTWVLDEGFEEVATEQRIALDENNDGTINQYYTVYGLEIEAGEPITLLEQANGGNRNMYGVAIAAGAPPVTFTYTILAESCEDAAVAISGTATPEGGAEVAVEGDSLLKCLEDCGIQVSGGVSSMLILGPIDLGGDTGASCDDQGRLATTDYLVDVDGDLGEQDIIVEEGDNVAPDFGGNAGGLGVLYFGVNPGINFDATAGILTTWRANADPNGYVLYNLAENIGAVDYHLTYSLAYLENRTDDCLDVMLEVASDDAVKVRVNGELVHVAAACRGAAAYGAGDMVPAVLVPGMNIVLIAVVEQTGDSGVRLVVRDANGDPLIDGSVQSTCVPPDSYPLLSNTEVTRAIDPSSLTVPDGGEITVTLSAANVSSTTVITDTFPAELEVVDDGGGQVTGNQIAFTVNADGDSVYTLRIPAPAAECPFQGATFHGMAEPVDACAKVVGGISAVACLLDCPPDEDSDSAELYAAFAFGTHDAALGPPDLDGLWCEVPNAPGEYYTAVYQTGEVLSIAYPNPDLLLADGVFFPDEEREWGYEILYQDLAGLLVNDPELPLPPAYNDLGDWVIYGAMDNSANVRNQFGDTCPEQLYDSFIGAKNFLNPCNATVVGNPDDPCVEAGLAPDGVIFRVDVPNGRYRFVLAGGSADNTHAHRFLAEDGGEGPPSEIGKHVVLVDNFDQAQYAIGQTGGDPGDGVYAAVGFGDKVPPRGDGVAPDPQFVFMDEDGFATAGCPSSPTLEVTEGYIRFHCLQANANAGPGGAQDPNGGDLVLLEIWNVEGGGGGPQFRRGDADADGSLNITDGIFVLNFLFLGGPEPSCLEAADPNDDGDLNITDGIYILNYLFLGGPDPATPGAECGEDPAGSPDLGCESYPSC